MRNCSERTGDSKYVEAQFHVREGPGQIFLNASANESRTFESFAKSRYMQDHRRDLALANSSKFSSMTDFAKLWKSGTRAPLHLGFFASVLLSGKLERPNIADRRSI